MTRLSNERAALCREAVTEALSAIRRDDPATADRCLIHTAHVGVPPSEIVVEIVAQTGGTL